MLPLPSFFPVSSLTAAWLPARLARNSSLQFNRENPQEGSS